MRRPVWRIVVLALGVLPWIASLAPAQEGSQPPGFSFDFVEIPRKPKTESILSVQAQPGDLTLPAPISPNTGMPKLENPPDEKAPGYQPLVVQALQSGDYIDPRYIENSNHSNAPTHREMMRAAYQDQVTRLLYDFKYFYWGENLCYVGLAVAGAAPIANTHADLGIRDWYQHRVRPNSGVDQFAEAGKQVGEYKYVIPAFLAISFAGHLFPDNEYASVAAQYGDRSLRALAVGAPMVGILQVGLGSERPAGDSHWQPFQASGGASSYAFVGAVPFLTAAEMVDNQVLKMLLYAGSFWTTWACIHTDDHYTSQALVGWSIACLATSTVSRTDNERRMQFVPIAVPYGTGAGVVFRY